MYLTLLAAAQLDGARLKRTKAPTFPTPMKKKRGLHRAFSTSV